MSISQRIAAGGVVWLACAFISAHQPACAFERPPGYVLEPKFPDETIAEERPSVARPAGYPQALPWTWATSGQVSEAVQLAPLNDGSYVVGSTVSWSTESSNDQGIVLSRFDEAGEPVAWTAAYDPDAWAIASGRHLLIDCYIPCTLRQIEAADEGLLVLAQFDDRDISPSNPTRFNAVFLLDYAGRELFVIDPFLSDNDGGTGTAVAANAMHYATGDEAVARAGRLTIVGDAFDDHPSTRLKVASLFVEEGALLHDPDFNGGKPVAIDAPTRCDDESMACSSVVYANAVERVTQITAESDVIFVAGQSNDDFMAIQLDADGSLAQSFGQGGIVVDDVTRHPLWNERRGFSDAISLMALNENGSLALYLAGSTQLSNPAMRTSAILKLDEFGRRVQTFGQTGHVLLDDDRGFDFPLTRRPGNIVTKLIEGTDDLVVVGQWARGLPPSSLEPLPGFIMTVSRGGAIDSYTRFMDTDRDAKIADVTRTQSEELVVAGSLLDKTLEDSSRFVRKFSPRALHRIVPRQGNWHQSSRTGSGFDIQTYGDGEGLIVVWYTFREDSTPVWYMSTGPLSVAGYDQPLYQVDRLPEGDTEKSLVGHLSVTFTDTTHARLDWELNGRIGSYESLEFLDFHPDAPMRPVTGHWYAPMSSGWGVSIASLGPTQFWVVYLYDVNGKPVWVTGQTDSDAPAIVLQQGRGRCPHCPYTPSEPVGNVGEIRTIWADDNRESLVRVDVELRSPLTGRWRYGPLGFFPLSDFAFER